ncbi:MAG: Na/Pi cotransporter family protein [Betaproteobacteria bacterium]
MGQVDVLAGLAGGLGLFLFGVQMCSEGLQKVAGRRLRHLVKALTNRPVSALVVGVLATLGLQSSSAVSALVVGFVSAGVMTLSQALGVLLGSALGASLTAQLIAFKISRLALVLLFGGALLYLFARRTRRRSLGQMILGFGLLFYGMLVMTSAVTPIRGNPAVVQTLIKLEVYPLVEFVVALTLTAVIQSSSAFLALLMSLAAQGLIRPSAIIPFVLGAHLGGTVTGVLSSLGAPGRDGKRAAVANFLFKLVNALLFLPFSQPLARLAAWSSPDPTRQIANAHTFFSIAMALGFLPLTAAVARLTVRLLPERRTGLAEAKFLDPTLLSVPEVALEQAYRQTVEMGRILRQEMLELIPPVLQYGDDELADRLKERELAVDSLYRQISKYVTSLGTAGLADELMERGVKILYAANDFEHIGDLVMNITQIALKLRTLGLEFSEEGREEIEALNRQVLDHFDLAFRAFADWDQEVAGQAIKERPRLLRFEKGLRYSHFDRLQAGNPKTVASSPLHLDLIEAILRIDSHAVNIAQVVLGLV